MPAPVEQTTTVPASGKRSRIRRLLIIVAGWLFVALGIAGLFLPFLQGVLFLLIGFVILAMEYPWAGRLLAYVRLRFPGVGKVLHKAHTWVRKAFGATHRNASEEEK